MAKGSHATRGGWEPTVCCICGQPILVTKQALRFNRNLEARVDQGWHVQCETEGWPHLKEDTWERPPSPTSR